MKDSPQIQASKSLEEIFFSIRVFKKHLTRLRMRCESYQSGSPQAWDPHVFEPYSQYFGLLSALKMKAALLEAFEYGYLEGLGTKLQLTDIGAGTLGASLGAIDFFKELQQLQVGAELPQTKIEEIEAIDLDHRPIDWATERFAPALNGVSLHKSKSFNFDASSPSQIIFGIDVFNEAGLENSALMNSVEKALELAGPKTLFIFIEPASKQINQTFIRWRDSLIQRKLTNVLLPCTHSDLCPAITQREWCHEERNYRAPAPYWNLVRDLGFDRSYLRFSMLILGKQKSQLPEAMARIVSRRLSTKGKVEYWLCSKGDRFKVRYLKRDRTENGLELLNLERGNLVDSARFQTPE